MARSDDEMSFLEKLTAAIERNESRLCIGLDPMLEALPEGVERSAAGMLRFNRDIIEATADVACAYKPNTAFYEALGSEGWRVLEETVRAIPDDIPVIADAKRGDIASTAEAYARALFDHLGCDACTLSPYLGIDAVTPFLARPGRFVFVLCRTSNPSAGELQDTPVDEHAVRARRADGARLGQARIVVALSSAPPIPWRQRELRPAAPDLWLLAPGIGAQSGDLTAAARALAGSAGTTIWNASRAITGAGRGRDFAAQAHAAAETLRRQINGAVASD